MDHVLEVHRPRGVFWQPRAFEIAVDSHTVAKIRAGHTRQATLAPGRHDVRVTVGKSHSNTVTVEAVEGGHSSLVVQPADHTIADTHARRARNDSNALLLVSSASAPPPPTAAEVFGRTDWTAFERWLHRIALVLGLAGFILLPLIRWLGMALLAVGAAATLIRLAAQSGRRKRSKTQPADADGA